TVIEPSKEYGYRDLEEIQRARKNLVYSKQDLRLPLRLFLLRKKRAKKAALDQVAKLLEAGKGKDAAAKLKLLE
ncbi:MAG TPA: hypothetical protein VK934_01615, partial [Fimbriimonas sp.]|nr:hypothetical protein [Fimbriimonas sp.]